MLAALARLATRRPRRVLGATALLFVVAVVVGGPVAGLLSTGNDFADPGAESIAAGERIEAAAGVEPSPSIIVLVRPQGGDVRAPAARGRVAEVARALRAIPGVARVTSIADAPSPALVSRDGSATYLTAALRPLGDDGRGEVADAVRARLGDEPDVTLGGPAFAGPAVGDQVSEDLARAELLAFPILFGLSLVVFRGMVAALLPLFVGVLSIFGTFLALRLVNEVQLLSIYALNLAIATGLGLAIDYSLFVVSRFREELDRGLEPAAALARTLATAGRTVLFSALTVAAALASLLVFPQRFLYSMGLSGALCALIAALVTLTALPALLALLGHRVNALAPARLRHRAVPLERGLWFRLSRAVMRRPGAVAAATAALLIVVGLPFLRIEFTGVDASVLPEDAAPRIVDTALRTEFEAGATRPVLAVVTAPEGTAGEVRAYAQRLGELPGAEGVMPPRFLGRQTWQVAVAPTAPALDERTLELVRDVRDVRGEPAPGPVLVGGFAAEFVDQQQALGDRLPLALAILALTTLVILFAMTGSVVLPVKALVMNVLTLSAAFGLLVLVFQDGRLEGLLGYTSQGALESTQPLVLLAVAFALSTDYGVFLLTRIKEAHDGGLSTDDAVAVGLQRTGRIVTAAALLLCVALGAFATSEMIFIKQVGLGVAAAVLIDATIVRALLVPALIKLLGDWNWWAPAPLRRLHARLPEAA
jgi:RND superfamily putative drug exporter